MKNDNGVYRKRRKTLAALAASSALALALAACTGPGSASSSTGGPKAGGTLTFGTITGPNNINPALSDNGGLSAFLMPAYEPLIKQQSDGKLVPGLATSWKFTDSSNEKFEMTIRSGAKFSDGSSVTAAAVAASMKYFQHADGPFASLLKTVTSVQTAGADRVTVTLNAPDPDLPYIFTQISNPGDIIAPAGLSEPTQLGNKTFGAGPYMLDPSQTVAGSTYTYVPNPYYWDKASVHWNKVVLKVFSNENSGIEALQSGQIQVLTGDPQDASSLPSSIDVLQSAGSIAGLWFYDRAGTSNPALGNVKVRQAMNYAIDRKAIASALYGSNGTATDQLQGAGYVGNVPNYDAHYTYDLGKAKSLLAEAGYPNGFTTGVVVPVISNYTTLAQAIADQLAKVGITLKLKIDPVISQWGSDGRTGKYGGTVSTLKMGPPSVLYNTVFGPDSAYNKLHSADPQLTALYNAALSAPSAQQKSAWQAVYKWTIDNAWMVPVASTSVLYFASKTVDAPEPGTLGTIDPTTITPAS